MYASVSCHITQSACTTETPDMTFFIRLNMHFQFFQPEACDTKGTRKIRCIISMMEDDAENLIGQGAFPSLWIKLTAQILSM